MYLMSMNNLDYVWVTIYFAIIAVTAYCFRRKNKTSNDFLFSATKVDKFLFCFGTFGVIEITLAGYAGSVLGMSAVYMLAVVICVVTFWLQRLCSRYYIVSGVTNFNDYVYNSLGKPTGLVIALLNIVLLLGLCVITVSLTAKLFQSLLGWNFINSVIGITGLTMIYVLMGGIQAVRYNRIIQILTIMFVFILVISLAVWHLGGFGQLSDNLSALALKQNKATNFYTTFYFNSAKLVDMVLLLVGLGGFYLLNFTTVKQNEDEINSGIWDIFAKFVLVLILVLPGLIAIGTKVTGNNINGKEIITLQAQLPDGQTGYIVKAVENNSNHVDLIPGIVPPMIDPITSMAKRNSYNYELASIVTLRHYLPGRLQFLIVLMIFAAFMLAIASFLINCCRILLRNIVLPYNVINRYGDVGEIWLVRIGILFFGTLTLALAFFLLPYFSVIQDTCFLCAVLIAPLFASLILAMFTNKSGPIYIPVLFAVLIAIIMNFTLNNLNLLHKYSIITVVSFAVTLLFGLFINCVRK